MHARKTVLVIGGSGTFGGRLVKGLASTTNLGILVAGRNRARAEAIVAEVRRTHPAAEIRPVVLDRNTVSAQALSTLDLFAVVDAAGPFQNADYAVARAAIEAGVHYLDLADARDFVVGFRMLGRLARQARVTALTGASSTPALSNAALDRITEGWQQIETVEIAIYPGNHTPRGTSVMQAILSYAGQPVPVFLDGAWTTRSGWSLLARRRLPGIGSRWLSLCDTPDLDIVPGRFDVQDSVVFRGGLELSLLHLGLAAATMPVRAGVLRSLEPFAKTFRSLADLLIGFGSARGGMLVEASGRDGEGKPIRARWSLVADGGDGPCIPTLPALAVLRALAAGDLDRPGASACVGVLPLEKIEAEFAPYRITTEIQVSAQSCGDRARTGSVHRPDAGLLPHRGDRRTPAIHGR